MTDTEIILALACVFLLCMLVLSLIERRKTFMDGERVGYLRAVEKIAERLGHDGIPTLDELKRRKKERSSDEH